ncbi:1-deoxy-D-xylulose-5-phosphate reductoisomerase [Bacillus sp. HMF5848]|uniref:1-deoxy-D-xylulose-5-phosphate reductoisomerase n=1 Tax=Bacillus sp. HMF5848 TaxID=2495421 RepID=UPI000F77935B|nr:1-deoxy-D-xylulose-5-phosphate reductoisomerase [Bacillus sp. HMF5848]RSK27063.1 1-deoxy-D-xylulose-5-phosphate reductoisomerase [Bacillus sp. HMF5848]
MKRICLLGATGSIGKQTLNIIENHPEDFSLLSFSFGSNIEEAMKIIATHKPKLVACANSEHKAKLEHEFSNITVITGMDGFIEAATHNDIDVVVNAMLGSVGLKPTLQAIEAGKTIALANKETLVTAGHIVMDYAHKYSVPILPVDSEHSAIFQSLQGNNEKRIHKLILTASGGSFRDKSRSELQNVTVKDALNHPNWSMGAKITIDSATMMNKGLEVIEAHWLFDMDYEKIDVLMHRESIIHSMVEYTDSSVMAQLGTPDMRVPIQYALTYPDRLELIGAKRLDLSEIATLHFQKIDFSRFRCLQYAYDAGKSGGTYPTVLNAANEEAVAAFLAGRITFLQIEDLIEQALHSHEIIHTPSLEAIMEVDAETRQFVRAKYNKGG